MKFFSLSKVLLPTILVASALYTSLAFSLESEITVNGEHASMLYNALANSLAEAGLSQPPTPGISTVHADSINCSESSAPSMPGLPSKTASCKITVNSSTATVNDAYADALAEALTDAGVPSSDTATPETIQISAGSVGCSSGMGPNGATWHCTIN